MKIVTWNVNSIRARIDNVKKYLKTSSPDMALLQEIKTEEHSYPFVEIDKLGYTSYVNGQKSYNGVSILSKKKLNKINKILPGDKIKQSRLISAKIKIKNKDIEIINPKILVLLGSTALNTLIGSEVVISKARGQWIQKEIGSTKPWIIASFHPAFLMRQPEQKKLAWIDLKMIREKSKILKI